MGYLVKNGMDVVLDVGRFDTLLIEQGYGQVKTSEDGHNRTSAHGKYVDFWSAMVRKYPIGLTYKSFLNLVGNRITWKLVYAWVVAEMLGVPVRELFRSVDQ